MTNAMQLKARIGALSAKTGVPHQIILQNYMMERLLARMAASSRRDAFILKGGFLLSALFGIGARTTMDMDVTLSGVPVREETIRALMDEICAIDVGDGVRFELRKLEEIREGDEYEGWRPSLKASFNPVAIMLKMDITAGGPDHAGSRPAIHTAPSGRGDDPRAGLQLRDHPRGKGRCDPFTCRSRHSDARFYDISTTLRLRGGDVSRPLFAEAVRATAKHRGTASALARVGAILARIAASPVMRRRWSDYVAANPYAAGLRFSTMCEDLSRLLSEAGLV